MIIFNGKKEAEEILKDLQKKIIQDQAAPVLGIIFAGEDPASELFVRTKKREALEIGIRIDEYRFAADSRISEIMQKIRQLNRDKGVHGIIVQLPLPPGLNTKIIVDEVSPEKDVDGFGEKARFQPPLILAIMSALKAAADASEKNILAIVNSDIFGATLKRFLAKENLRINYLLSDEVANRKNIIQTADIVITALGRSNFLTGDLIKEGAILIDAGIVVSESGKVVGDIDQESVFLKASFLTPVPGGIGPLTVAYLLQNVFLAYKQSLMK